MAGGRDVFCGLPSLDAFEQTLKNNTAKSLHNHKDVSQLVHGADFENYNLTWANLRAEPVMIGRIVLEWSHTTRHRVNIVFVDTNMEVGSGMYGEPQVSSKVMYM